MIQNDPQLQVVRDQLARAERALASLRDDVENERNFAVFSEGYVGQIAELRAEIDAYRATKEKDKTTSKGGKRRPRQAS